MRRDPKGDVRGQWRRRYQRLRARVLEALGGKCVRCGFVDARALHIDHVFNDGAQERRVLKSKHRAYHKYMTYILENKESGRYQVLCANCNAIKESERREAERMARSNE